MAANPFALSPALVGENDPLDYSTRAGQHLYSSAIAQLPYTFTGKESSLPAFLQSIRDRSAQAGWDDIFSIMTATGAKNLLTQYGEITLANVHEDAINDYIGQQVRNAQISHQIYQCLKRSITPDVAERMVTESDSYMVNNVADGPSFLMTLIQVYFVQTEALPSSLRLLIADAHNLIVTLDYDIDSFNTTINAYVQKLAANGHQTQDLFAHMIRAYKEVPDKHFQQYITNKVDNHFDNTNRLTLTRFMTLAKEKYDEMKEDNTWMKSSDNIQEQLVALTAQIEQMEQKNKQLHLKLKQKFQPNQSNRTLNAKSNKKVNDKWAWKDKAPRKGDKTTKDFKGKTYHWCPTHKKWTLHKPDECRLKDKKLKKNNEQAEGDAYAAIYDEDGSFSNL